MKSAAKLLSKNPELLHTFINSRGQKVDIYEHPVFGDAAPTYAVIGDQMMCTDFWDTEDMYAGSDYEPILTEIGIRFAFEEKSI